MGRIVLISSHIVDDIESLCDHVAIMNYGRMLVSGTTAEIQAKANRNVMERVMPEAEFRELEKNYTVISFAPQGDNIRARYLTHEQMAAATVTSPSGG